MPTAARIAEVAEIDAYLAEPKLLRGSMVIWSEGQGHANYQATWVIEDHDGLSKSHLRFSCSRAAMTLPTISLIVRGRAIWRVEIEDGPRHPHRNPTWASSLGLPALVNGSHEHSWPDNRSHILNNATDWTLPCRRPLHSKILKLPQALAAFAASINLGLDSQQRLFDVPSQQEMF